MSRPKCLLGLPCPQKCDEKFFGEFDLKCDNSDGKNLVKSGGRLSSCQESFDFSDEFRRKFRGLPTGPGRKVPQRVFLECFWAPGSDPKDCSEECFSHWRTSRPGRRALLMAWYALHML